MHVSMYVKIKNINEYNTYMYMYILYIYTPPFQPPPQKKTQNTDLFHSTSIFLPPSWPETEPSVCCQRCVYAPCLAVFSVAEAVIFLFTLEATYIPGTSGKPMYRNKFAMQCGVTFRCVVGNFRMCCGASYCMCGDIPKN